MTPRLLPLTLLSLLACSCGARSDLFVWYHPASGGTPQTGGSPGGSSTGGVSTGGTSDGGTESGGTGSGGDTPLPEIQWVYLGASASAQRAHLGLAYNETSGPNRRGFVVEEYEKGELISSFGDEWTDTRYAQGFAVAPDGTTYVTRPTINETAAEIRAWTPSHEPLWTLEVPWKINLQALRASDSHLVSVTGPNSENDPFELEIGSVRMDQSEPQVAKVGTPFVRSGANTALSVGVDSNEGLWITGPIGTKRTLTRYDSVEAAPEVALSDNTFAYAFAVAPEGYAHVAWNFGGVLHGIKYGINAEPLLQWAVEPPSLPFAGVAAVAVGPAGDLYMALAADKPGDPYVVKYNLDSGLAEFEAKPDASQELIFDLVVTGTGDAYIAGIDYTVVPYGVPFIRQVFRD